MKRSTVVAFFVLLALIGAVYWLERDEGEGSAVDRVFDIAEDEIERVEIRRLADEPVVVERDGDGFRVVRPVDATADRREVDLVLSNLVTMTEVRSFALESDMNAAEFGLDVPRLEVLFATASGEHGIRFGKDTLTPSNQYAARIGSDDVLVVASHSSNNLERSAWDLRDKTIFHLPDEVEPVRVSIASVEETVELSRIDDGWWIENPARARVDRFTVTGMVARFERAEMLSLADSADEPGLDSPTHRLEVTFDGDTEALMLQVGAATNVDYYARTPSRDDVFVIEGGLVAELQKNAADWWSRKLLHEPTTEATVVTILTGDDERSIDRDEAQDLLSALSGAVVDDVVAGAPAGEPSYVITVSTENVEDAIAFYDDAERTHAIRADEEITLRLTPETWTAIRNALTDDG